MQAKRRHDLTAADLAHFNVRGASFVETGISFKSGIGFRGPDWMREVTALETKLEFAYPREYLRLITRNGQTAAGRFASGWWKIPDAKLNAIVWSSCLSLSIRPDLDEGEDTQHIASLFHEAGLGGVPFGDGFRIDRVAKQAIDGWLYFDRRDHSLWFTDFDFARPHPLAADFLTMMKRAGYVAFDA